ncbi:hypothetical protein KKF61_05960 [Patescibacteria group bacterium]|nr:hypothetical protein [Patescibacteria group bacterium]
MAENRGFFGRIGDFVTRMDEKLREKPIRRAEDLLALFGLGFVLNRSQTFWGSFIWLLSFVLTSGHKLGTFLKDKLPGVADGASDLFSGFVTGASNKATQGWNNLSELAGKLHTYFKDTKWAPYFEPKDREPVVTSALRSLINSWTTYRYLFPLALVMILSSMAIWLVTAAGVWGIIGLILVLGGIMVWSWLIGMGLRLAIPLGCVLGFGLVIAALELWTNIPDVHFWFMVGGLMSLLIGMTLLGVLLWPLVVIAKWMSAPKDTNGKRISYEKIDGKSTAVPFNVSLNKFVLSVVKIATWPVFLGVYTIWFSAWDKNYAFFALLVMMLGLSMAGITQPLIRLWMNRLTVGNIWLFLILCAIRVVLPTEFVECRDYIVYHDGDITDPIRQIGIDKYWDWNPNGIPDQGDLDFIAKAMSDRSRLPRGDSSVLDINGDGEVNEADTAYFRRHMDKEGPPPVPLGYVPPKIDSNQVAGTRTVGVGMYANTSQQQLSIRLDTVEISGQDVQLKMTWKNTLDDENARVSISRHTKLVISGMQNGKTWREELLIKDVRGDRIAIDGWHTLPVNESYQTTLVFTHRGRKIDNMSLIIQGTNSEETYAFKDVSV